MTRELFLILAGVLVILSPWSGLPLAILSWVLPVLGLVVAAISYTLYKRQSEHAAPTVIPGPPAPPPPARMQEDTPRRPSHIAFS